MDMGKISWRMTISYYPFCKHSLRSLAYYTLLEIPDIACVCVCSSKSPASSSLVVPPLASSLPHRTSNAFQPLGFISWSVVSNYWIWSWVGTRPARTSWRTEESVIPAMQLRLPRSSNPYSNHCIGWGLCVQESERRKEWMRKDDSNTCVLWNS